MKIEMKTTDDYCGSSMCRNGCASMLNFNEPCAHIPIENNLNQKTEK